MSGIWTLTVPLLPEMPAAEECGCPREILPEGFQIEWVGGVGLAEARDAPCGSWRVYQRFFRPKPGTEPTFRVNRIATDLLRLADSTIAPVYERVVIVGLGPGGRLAHVPQDLVTHARQIWERYASRRNGVGLYPTAHLQVAAGS
jgi:hypothetical protein